MHVDVLIPHVTCDYHHGIYPSKKIRKYSMLGVPNPGPLIRHETRMTGFNFIWF